MEYILRNLMPIYLYIIRLHHLGWLGIFHPQCMFKEGPEGGKWEPGFANFWAGKWDFMHWDWDSSTKKQNKKWE